MINERPKRNKELDAAAFRRFYYRYLLEALQKAGIDATDYRPAICVLGAWGRISADKRSGSPAFAGLPLRLSKNYEQVFRDRAAGEA